MQIHTAGESALIVYLGDATSPEVSARVQALAEILKAELGGDLVDLVPSYASLLVIYDAMTTDHLSVSHRVRAAEAQLNNIRAGSGHEVVLPVYYHPEAGEDLEALAERANVTIDEVIERHSSCE